MPWLGVVAVSTTPVLIGGHGMRFLFYLWYALRRTSQSEHMAKLTLRQHIAGMKKSGHTKILFDVDGHTVVIQSHKHVEDNRA